MKVKTKTSTFDFFGIFILCSILLMFTFSIYLIFNHNNTTDNDSFNIIKDNTRIIGAEILDVNYNTNEILFLLDDGTENKTIVENSILFSLDGYYMVVFDTQGTDTFQDDVIVKTFLECW